VHAVTEWLGFVQIVAVHALILTQANSPITYLIHIASIPVSYGFAETHS
jgi:hypothetical protein